jgi:hypothetical protein
LNQSSPDLVNATVASAFSNKSPAWFQRTIHSSQRHIGTLNPVQHGVTEYGIEFFVEQQLFAADRVRVQAELPRGFDLRDAGIDRNHFTTQIRQPFREYAVSATKIEDPFAGLRCQQIHDGRS